MTNSIWDTNISVIQKKDEVLYENLMKDSEQSNLIVDVEIIEDRKVLYAVQEDKQFQLDSLYDSDYLLETWYKGLQVRSYKSKVVMFGFGNGMYVRTLLRNFKKEIEIIVYEPSIEVFRKVLGEFDCSHILEDDRVHIVVGSKSELNYADTLFQFIDIRDIEDLIFEDYLNYPMLFPEEKEKFHRKLELTCQTVLASQDVMGRFGNRYYINTTLNFRSFTDSKSLQGLWQLLPKGMPAIIVSAGPSLDKNVLELNKAKGRSFIIATDTALKVLLANDIIPDIFITVDGQKSPLHFDEEKVQKIPMICNLQSRFEILQNHKAAKFFVHDMNSHVQEFLGREEILLPVTASGGSVANEAFSIAQMLDFSTIIFVGQDLAYTGNKTHSTQTKYGEKEPDFNIVEKVEIEGIDGNPIISCLEFMIYLEWFESQIKQHPELRVIDATEGGAKIHGTVIMTLEEALQDECNQEVDVEAIINNTPDFFTQKQKKDFIDYIYETPDRMENMRHIIKIGIRYYDKMIQLTLQNKQASNEMKRLMEKIKQITTMIEQDTSFCYAQHFMQEYTTEILTNIYKQEDDEKTEILKVCEMGKRYLSFLDEKLVILTLDFKQNRLAQHLRREEEQNETKSV